MPSRERAVWSAVLLLVVGTFGACKKQERKDVDDIPGEESSSGDGVGGGTANPTTGGAGGGPSSDLTEACEAFCAKATELGCGQGCTVGCGLLTGSCAPENIALYDCARTTEGYMSCDSPSVVAIDPSKGCDAESKAVADCI